MTTLKAPPRRIQVIQNVVMTEQEIREAVRGMTSMGITHIKEPAQDEVLDRVVVILRNAERVGRRR